MSRPETWVEVIGLPGCGKTTAIRNNLDRLRSCYKVIESRKPTLASRIRARWLYETCLKKSDLPEPLARKLAYRLSFRPSRFTSKPVFFFDSGLLQVFFEYLIDVNFADQELLLEWMRNLYIPNKLLFMFDEIDLVTERELTRSNRRYSGLDLTELSRRYKVADELMRERFLPLAEQVYFVNLATDYDLAEVIEK